MQYIKMAISGDATQPDTPPKSLNIGAINPYALADIILGRPINRDSPSSAQAIAACLQADYDELFDMKYDSVLYAGLKLNQKSNLAERLSGREMHTLNEDDMVTPDMSKVRKISDLKDMGLEDVGDTPVKLAFMQNGKLRLVLQPHRLGRTLANNAITQSLRDTVTPYRGGEKGEWIPPNANWENPGDMIRRLRQIHFMRGQQENIRRGILRDIMHQPQNIQAMQTILDESGSSQNNDIPVQGAVGNSWLISALFAVAWADPFFINRDVQIAEATTESHKERTFQVKFYSKGGENDGNTTTIKVNQDVPINNSTNMPVYSRPSGEIMQLWPSLYEKAFAKWLTSSSSDHPDLTRLSPAAEGGDPVKAMAQLNDGSPKYFFTQSRSAADLVSLVRANSVSFKTIRPMVAFTHATGDVYRGSNMVANHSYTVLGWAFPGGSKQYIVVRNPFGVTEPRGLTSYPGLLDTVDTDFWEPAALLDRRGVLAIESEAFKQYFACIGMSK